MLDHRSDLFSLGILLYEMATGRRPFAGATPTDVLSAIVSQPPIAPREIHAAIPAELDRIIAKALEKQPALRYQTASDVRADLQRLKRDLDRASSGHGQAAALAALPPVRWSLWSRTTAAVGASVIVAAGWWVVAAARARSSASDSTAVLRGPVRTSDVELPARVETLKDAATGVVAPPTSADSAARDTSPAADYLLVARRQIDLKLYDQALDNLRKVAQDTHQQTAIEASFLMASVYESRDDRANAMGTYIEIAHRFPASSRAAEALAKLAESTMKSRQRDKEHDARRTLTELVTKYPRSPWAPRALLMRGDIEARQGTAQPDALLGGSVPTAAVTYREIGDRYPSSDSAPSALNKLARIYTETKRYELAAATFERLAAHDANDRYGAWFAAGEIYEKRLKDQTRARAAYSRVRPSSPQYAQARKRISR